jgi:hypothetical protein
MWPVRKLRTDQLRELPSMLIAADGHPPMKEVAASHTLGEGQPQRGRMSPSGIAAELRVPNRGVPVEIRTFSVSMTPRSDAWAPLTKPGSGLVP